MQKTAHGCNIMSNRMRHVSCCYYLSFIKTTEKITVRVEHGHVNAMRELVNCESPAQHSTATAIGE